MVMGKSSIVIYFELQIFFLTTNQFNVFCLIRFLPNEGAVNRISLTFQSKYNGAWLTWGKVPKRVQNLWFGEFKVTKVTTH